uniref:Uncharacterized protein n=1 Tax=Knipowitschia caucasica TaxID=637954 RepID=A0AAV2LQ27_KNICA
MTLPDPDAAVNPTFTLRPERSPHSSTPEQPQNKEPEPSLLLLLLLLVPLVLMLSVVVCYKQRKSDENGAARTEGVVYEPCAAATESADITYQSLCAETREHNIYSSLTAPGTPPPGGQRL